MEQALCSMIFSSATGNTKLLAEAVHRALPHPDGADLEKLRQLVQTL